MLATTTLQPFRIEVSDDDLADLHSRIARANWPNAGPGGDDSDWSRGVPTGYLQGLARRWAADFDWRAQEAALNAIPEFTTTIDGQPIHVFHARSSVDGALPLLLLHSWPGSPIEFAKMVGPLTDPAGHGGDAADAFDVVIPSIPGFGYSTPVTEQGWSSGRIGRAFAALMQSLGTSGTPSTAVTSGRGSPAG